MYCSAFRAIGQNGDDDDQEDQRERGQHERQRDLVRRALPERAFDQRDHAVEERLAGPAVIRTTMRSESTVVPPVTPGSVAAGLANHRRGFAGDRRFIDDGDAFDDLAVAGNDLARLDDDAIARPEVGRRDLSRSIRSARRRKAGVSRASCAANRLAPCRAPRRAPWRSWRTAPSGTARRRAR